MRQTPSDSRALLQYVKIADLKAYLEKTGWTEELFSRKDVIKFRSPYSINADQEYIDTFIPVSEKLGGSKWMIEHAIKTISSFEDKATEEIIIKILVFADCLKSRIIEAKRGMIYLNRGIILYKGLRDLITSSASFELDPSAKKPSRIARAKKYANSSLIGQSEYGSYIANIYIPLDKPNKDFDFTATPFQRKVVLRILKGMQFLNDSMDEESAEPIIRNYKEGLNLDMCCALSDIIDAGNGNNVIINAILEPAYKPPSDILTEFTLTPKCKYYLDEAIETLKEEKKKYVKEGQWSGFPRLFDRSESAQRGEIRLETIDVDNGHIFIHINLNDNDYQICARANLEKKRIEINGVLEKVGSKWILNDPNGLEIVGGKLRKIGPEQISFKDFENG